MKIIQQKVLERRRKYSKARSITPWKRRVLLDKCPITLYSIGWLAVLCNRHVMYLRQMDYRKILPRPLFHGQLDTDIRYYTAAELAGYATILNTFPRKPGTPRRIDWKALQDRLHSFKEKLAGEMRQKNFTRILKPLPQEEAIEKVMRTTHRKKDFTEMAQRIVDGMPPAPDQK